MLKLETPKLRPWRAGQQLDADDFNEVQEALEFLLDPPTCRIWTRTTQSIPEVSWTQLQFSNAYVEYDNCAQLGAPMWTNSNPHVVTVQVEGIYEITGSICWASGQTVHRLAAISHNGLTPFRGRTDNRGNGAAVFVQKTYIERWCNVGDEIELWGTHHHTAALSTYVGTSPTPYRQNTSLRLRWVSL